MAVHWGLLPVYLDVLLVTMYTLLQPYKKYLQPIGVNAMAALVPQAIYAQLSFRRRPG